MSEQVNETTRRYPRTLDEAFNDSTYACPITKPNGHVIAFHGAMRPKRHRVGKRPAWFRIWLVVRDTLRYIAGNRA